MSERAATVRDAIRVLNEALEAEPEAVRAIFACRPDTGGGLDDHPTIQVGGERGKISALGLINGIFGVREADGYGYITAEFDDAGAVGAVGAVRRFMETAPIKWRATVDFVLDGVRGRLVTTIEADSEDQARARGYAEFERDALDLGLSSHECGCCLDDARVFTLSMRAELLS
jgi:hypothetical protein